MTLPPPLRASLLGLLCCCAALQAAPSAPWDQASQFLFNDAYQSFKTLPAPGRAERLGTAAVLLNVQPRTTGNLDTARASLESLVAENASDEPGLNARFLLGRIAGLHQNPPDLAVARRYFDALIAGHPQHPLAQQAVVKRALMDLYPSDGKPPAVSLYASCASQADALTDPSARRDLHLVLARACLFHQAASRAATDASANTAGFDPSAYALTHYRAALATNALSFRVRGETLVAVGELARKRHLDAVAADAYRAFLASYSRDIRAGTIGERLAALEAGKASAALTP